MREQSGTLERVCSFLRCGAGVYDAVFAAGIKEDDSEKWIEENAYWIRRAQAQFVVLACNKMMTEGGANGAKYLLEHFRPAFEIAGTEQPPDQVTGGDFQYLPADDFL